NIWEPFRIGLKIAVTDGGIACSPWLIIYDDRGEAVLSAFMYDGHDPIKVEPGTIQAVVDIQPNVLMPGTYNLSCGLFGRCNEFYDWSENVLTFRIGKTFEDGRPFDHRFGQVSHPFAWNWERQEDRA